MVPAIVYGGEREAAMISIAHNEFIHELENESIYTQVIELHVGDRKQEVILRDLQRHPFKNKVLHADFYRIDQNKPIHITVPIHVENAETCVGVKQDGGMLTQLVSEIEILALPKNLPEYLSVDAANLHLGEILHLTDILMPEGVQLVALAHIDVEDEEEFDQHNIGVLSVVKTREEIIEEEAPEAPEIEAGEEGEVAEGGAGEAEGEAGDED
jgi:large subunit ribosomal protein L25